MKCMSCGRTAKRYTVQNAKGECVVFLCADCYKRLYGAGTDAVEEEKIPQKECPACGTTYDDFKRTGLVGCAECYRIFREELVPVLGYLQRGIYHTGSAPVERDEAEYDELRALLAEQERLWEELEAVDDENSKSRIIERLEWIQSEIHRRGER